MASNRPPVSPGGDHGLPSELDPRGRRHAHRSRRAGQRSGRRRDAGADAFAGVRFGVRVLATVLSFAVLVGSGWAWVTYRNFTANVVRVNAITGDTSAAKKNIDGEDQNILLVGNDDRDTASDAELKDLGTERDGGSYNTDTMMLMHLPADGSKATIISFPRDSYVTIPAPDGDVKAKLNSAYTLGMQEAGGDPAAKKDAGAQLLVKTIENMTDLKIDHFIQVDLIGFYRISKALNGVTICLNSPMRPATTYGQEGDGYDSGFEPDGSFVYSYSGIDLPAGKSKVEGLQALAFVRQRHGLPRGDLDRIDRQHAFLAAVFNQVSSAGTLLNPFKLQKLVKAVASSLSMDDALASNPQNLVKLAEQMQNLKSGNLQFTTIPNLGDETLDGVGDVIVVNTDAMPAFIDQLIGRPVDNGLQSAKPADPSTVTVAVVNDTSGDGVEQTNARALEQAGFTTTIPPASSDVIARTTIRYPAGQEAAAKAVQQQVPGAVMQQTSDVGGVTLVLGDNGVQVASLMPGGSPTGATGGSSASPTSGSSSGTSAGLPGGAELTTAAGAGCVN